MELKKSVDVIVNFSFDIIKHKLLFCYVKLGIVSGVIRSYLEVIRPL